MADETDGPKTAKVLDFIPTWTTDFPMAALRSAENEIHQGRFDNVFIVLHKRDADGGSTFMALKNDMDYDSQAATALWLLGKVMGRTSDDT